jgi:enterochelin esterase-like enzyme
MKKLSGFLFLSLFLNQFTWSQTIDTAMAKKLLSGVFPSISGKDAGAFAAAVMGTEVYQLSEDSKKQKGVPEGTVTKYHMSDSKIYPGTERDYWIYVPKQYDAKKPACLMIFQDGEGYLTDSSFLATNALDNLINKKEVPVIIALFINSGDKGPGTPIYGGVTNRSVEYDAVGPTYPKFLIEEMMPKVTTLYNITKDPKGIALVGISSSSVAAFNAAWERPDVFGKVISHVGSFVDIRGGDKFPNLIRRTPKKPIKVFLQDGENDLNLIFGSWILANKEMAAALEYGGYDYKYVFGTGGHSLHHGGAIFPETLRWLWSDYQKQ